MTKEELEKKVAEYEAKIAERDEAMKSSAKTIQELESKNKTLQTKVKTAEVQEQTGQFVACTVVHEKESYLVTAKSFSYGGFTSEVVKTATVIYADKKYVPAIAPKSYLILNQNPELIAELIAKKSGLIVNEKEVQNANS